MTRKPKSSLEKKVQMKEEKGLTEYSKKDGKDGAGSPASEVVAEITVPATGTPSMTVSLFITWIVPVLIIAIVARFGVDTEPPAVNIPPKSRPIEFDVSKAKPSPKPSRKPTKAKDTSKMMMGMTRKIKPTSSPSPSTASPHPTSYQIILDEIESRKRLWKPKNDGPPAREHMSKPTQTSKSRSNSRSQPSAQSKTTPEARRSKDPQRAKIEEIVEISREEYKADPDNVFKATKLADALRQKDLMYHDGGLGQREALEAYHHAIKLTLKRREKMLTNGEPTNMSRSGTRSVPDEMFFDYLQKSVDGMLCALYTNRGKLYFMANMFERAVESYTECIEIENMYLDAVGSRGSSLIILGKYAEAAEDLRRVIENDSERLFKDAFTAMAKVLVAKEDVVPQGWGPMVKVLEELIESYEATLDAGESLEQQHLLAEALNRLHHVMFTYHDAKTKNQEAAWKHLTNSYKYKMATVEPYDANHESQKLLSTKAVFHKNFWSPSIGSQTNLPIFIIGFVRSGSTLLERVLDAHPEIVGTGEDSVFNGRLDHIRNSIVQASISGDMLELNQVVEEMADSVAFDMRERWKEIDANSAKDDKTERTEPTRFTDKMLTNYFNVGFIHMLFPNALILHVARNPMDVIWSAYKHEFPPGGLDYTSDFHSLANMYHSYREVMLHWDSVLPGRVTHVRYEDLVNDMPGVARAIIAATGLDWDDNVLDFHKKKQAVNTLSTSQVRKGIYKDSMNAWKKYEKQLRPLVKLVGDEVEWDLKTTLPSLTPTS